MSTTHAVNASEAGQHKFWPGIGRFRLIRQNAIAR
jgi:hypothetical protein